MNRINTIIDNHATMAVICYRSALLSRHDGYIEQTAEMTDRMMEARGQLKMWLKISQAIRGWQL